MGLGHTAQLHLPSLSLSFPKANKTGQAVLAALFAVSWRGASWGAGEGAGSPSKGGPNGPLVGEEFRSKGDGVVWLLVEQCLEEVRQQCPHLGVLLEVGSMGELQLLLQWGGQDGWDGHEHTFPPWELCQGEGDRSLGPFPHLGEREEGCWSPAPSMCLLGTSGETLLETGTAPGPLVPMSTHLTFLSRK